MILNCIIMLVSFCGVANLKGAQGCVPPSKYTPPTAQNVLNFMQFFAKFGKIICWRPPRRVAPPPTGNPGSAPAIDWKFTFPVNQHVN